MSERRIVAWTSVTLDDDTSGPDGPEHDAWLYEHAGRPQTWSTSRASGAAPTRSWSSIAYEGFYSVWPAMTRDERTDPRTRDLGRWLDATEKVVVSRTLTDAPWEHSRIARDLAAEIAPAGRTRPQTCSTAPPSSASCRAWT